MFELRHRYSDAILPDVYLVDLKSHLHPEQSEILSDVLIDELYYNLKHGEQSILLLNRRGYHTIAACMECGEVDLCPHCSVALTYHKANGRMMCHYCGYSHKQDFICHHCGSKHMKLTGLGTQKLEDEVAKLFRTHVSFEWTRIQHFRALLMNKLLKALERENTTSCWALR